MSVSNIFVSILVRNKNVYERRDLHDFGEVDAISNVPNRRAMGWNFMKALPQPSGWTDAEFLAQQIRKQLFPNAKKFAAYLVIQMAVVNPGLRDYIAVFYEICSAFGGVDL